MEGDIDPINSIGREIARLKKAIRDFMERPKDCPHGKSCCEDCRQRDREYFEKVLRGD